MQTSVVLMYAAILALLLVECSVVATQNKCAGIQGQKNFDVKRFLGNWYEYKRAPKDGHYGTTCAYTRFNVTKVFNCDITLYSVGWQRHFMYSRVGFGTFKSQSQRSEFSVSLGAVSKEQPSEYVIVDTDYDTYALMVVCNMHFSGEKKFWIMTRKRGVKPRNLNALESKLRALGAGTFEWVSQVQCTDGSV